MLELSEKEIKHIKQTHGRYGNRIQIKL
jgi:hypothetical protein